MLLWRTEVDRCFVEVRQAIQHLGCTPAVEPHEFLRAGRDVMNCKRHRGPSCEDFAGFNPRGDTDRTWRLIADEKGQHTTGLLVTEIAKIPRAALTIWFLATDRHRAFAGDPAFRSHSKFFMKVRTGRGPGGTAISR